MHCHELAGRLLPESYRLACICSQWMDVAVGPVITMPESPVPLHFQQSQEASFFLNFLNKNFVPLHPRSPSIDVQQCIASAERVP